MLTNSHWYNDLDMSDFAERLKSSREARKMTQVRFCELLDISPRVYCRWEKGDNVPHLDTIIKIANILQVSMDELVGRKQPKNEIKIRNYELHQLCQQADDLTDTDQKVLMQIIDSLIKRSQLSKMMDNTVTE